MLVNKTSFVTTLAGLALANIASPAGIHGARTLSDNPGNTSGGVALEPTTPTTTPGVLVTDRAAEVVSIERDLAALSTRPRVQGAAGAPSSEEELAKKLSNPVAALISVPFQFNYDENIGPDEDGGRTVLNVQPVVPFSLNETWNLISRTIVPITLDQSDIFPGSGDQDGLGDVLESLFLSPKAPTSKGVIWGVGPVFLIPTASDDLLGTDKWGIGPTALALKQSGPWTYGGLFNHIWSFAGDDNRADINSTFIQPFGSYTTPTAWTYTLNSESTYDWEAEEWSIPINMLVSKLTKLGGVPISIGAGLRYWLDSAPNGPEDFGLRFVITPLFPK